MIAPLHESHPAEATPLFDAVTRDLAGHEARQIVRAGLKVYAGERVTKRQRSAVRLRILNTAPILQAVTSNV